MEVDFQCLHSDSPDYFHMNWNGSILPDEVRFWINGSKFRMDKEGVMELMRNLGIILDVWEE